MQLMIMKVAIGHCKKRKSLPNVQEKTLEILKLKCTIHLIGHMNCFSINLNNDTNNIVNMRFFSQKKLPDNDEDDDDDGDDDIDDNVLDDSDESIMS